MELLKPASLLMSSFVRVYRFFQKPPGGS